MRTNPSVTELDLFGELRHPLKLYLRSTCFIAGNMLRVEGAVALSKALKGNTTLKTLNLRSEETKQENKGKYHSV